ncbi:DUF5677 domain-containing protein [Bacillus subtilis]|nr:DUF5677 domain-containing protein [Bacillus subtilis]
MNTYQKMFDNILTSRLRSMLEEGQEIDKIKLDKIIHEETKYATKSISEGIYKELKSDIANMYTEQEEINKEFLIHLHKQWYEGFLILQGIIKVCEEVSIQLLDEFHKGDLSNHRRALALRVLFKLHSKSVQVGKEVLVLLKSGYSDGALARWRSLHEFNVIFKTLAYNFSDIGFTYNLIKRYLDYSQIERIKEIYTYKKATGLLNLEPIKTEDENRYRARRDQIIKKYGKDFEKPHMWAKPLFPQIKDRQIYFSDFEKLVGIDRLTPYYKQANYQVHASPKGIYQSLSMDSSVEQDSSYLYGGSSYGLRLPGQLTGISLIQITTKLLLLETNIDRLICSITLQKFVEDCNAAFSKIERQINSLKSDSK